jgi:hypothetical protein
MIIHTYFKKSKEKKKPGWQKIETEYSAWLKSHGIDVNKRKKKEFIPYVPKSEPYRRQIHQYPSLNSFVGFATKKESLKYTGNNLLGIGTLHKSNAVPIFSKEDAEDQAKMRR